MPLDHIDLGPPNNNVIKYAPGFHGPKEILFKHHYTVGQNNQEYRLKYWATRSSIRSFARTAHSWDSEWLDSYLICVFLYSGP